MPPDTIIMSDGWESVRSSSDRRRVVYYRLKLTTPAYLTVSRDDMGHYRWAFRARPGTEFVVTEGTALSLDEAKRAAELAYDNHANAADEER